MDPVLLLQMLEDPAEVSEVEDRTAILAAESSYMLDE